MYSKLQVYINYLTETLHKAQVKFTVQISWYSIDLYYGRTSMYTLIDGEKNCQQATVGEKICTRVT